MKVRILSLVVLCGGSLALSLMAAAPPPPQPSPDPPDLRKSGFAAKDARESLIESYEGLMKEIRNRKPKSKGKRQVKPEADLVYKAYEKMAQHLRKEKAEGTVAQPSLTLPHSPTISLLPEDRAHRIFLLAEDVEDCRGRDPRCKQWETEIQRLCHEQAVLRANPPKLTSAEREQLLQYYEMMLKSLGGRPKDYCKEIEEKVQRLRNAGMFNPA